MLFRSLAPDCFIIEEKLKEILDIPVFHDDQHGTAIITTAALINALDVSKKKINNVKIVVNGAGASAMACANLFKKSGVPQKNITMVDRTGVIFRGRDNLNQWKSSHAIDTKFIKGVAKTKSEMVILMDIEHLLSKSQFESLKDL